MSTVKLLYTSIVLGQSRHKPQQHDVRRFFSLLDKALRHEHFPVRLRGPKQHDSCAYLLSCRLKTRKSCSTGRMIASGSCSALGITLGATQGTVAVGPRANPRKALGRRIQGRPEAAQRGSIAAGTTTTPGRPQRANNELRAFANRVRPQRRRRRLRVTEEVLLDRRSRESL